ncbi:TadE/TadG family type IV pilus assembly protein [Micromonospora sp. NPDC049004]|uniref:TadE/TadG family type IV pilus assembly protein n=1 Tax=Micromonospora sp. NPDC049004 TaxID=3154348 RepID=UPI0033F93F42
MNRPAERGSVSIEVAVLAPAFIALMVLAGVAGRSAVAAEAVDAAAHDAARAASISRNATDGEKEARNAAQQQLDWHGLNCADTPTLNFEGSVGGKITSFKDAYGSALGENATVTVTVECRVSFQDLRLNAVPGMPSENRIEASFTSPLDRYRSRG